LRHLTCYTDGGCYNNGRASAKAYGSYLIMDKNKKQVAGSSRFDLVTTSTKKRPGRPTNNMAESLAINMALTHILNDPKLCNPRTFITICSDSELTINQINGIYKINNPQLLQISKNRAFILKTLGEKLGKHPGDIVEFTKVPRDEVFNVLGH